MCTCEFCLVVFEVSKGQLGSGAFCESLVEMSPADRNVAFVSADLNLFTCSDGLSGRINAQHHGRFSSTMADGFDFREDVSPCEEVLTSLEECALKIGSQSIGQHGYAFVICDFAEFSNLSSCQELRFVDEDTGDGILFVLSAKDFKQCVIFAECVSVCFESDA